MNEIEKLHSNIDSLINSTNWETLQKIDSVKSAEIKGSLSRIKIKCSRMRFGDIYHLANQGRGSK